MLRPGDCECALEIRFSFRRVRLGRHQRDFTGQAIDLSLGPPFLGCFDRRDRFASAAPSLLYLPKLCMRARQK